MNVLQSCLVDPASFWESMQQVQLAARSVDWAERLCHLGTMRFWPLELRNQVIVAYLATPGEWATEVLPEHEEILSNLLKESDRRLRLLAVQALTSKPVSVSEQLLQAAAADEAYEVSSLAWSRLTTATVAREVWRNYSAYCSEHRPELAGLLARQLPTLWELKPLGFRVGAKGYEVDLCHNWQLHSLQSLTLRVRQAVTIHWALRNGCCGEFELHKGDIWKAALNPGFASLRDKLLQAIDLTWLSPYHFHGANIETFFGRDDEIRQLLRPGTHWAVTGGRRIGKTSLLLKTAERLRQQGQTVLYLDCGAYRRWQDLLFALTAELNLPGGSHSPAEFLATFRQSLPRGLHLFLDETDVLLSAEPDVHSLLALLRSLAQQLEWQVVAAGYQSLQSEMRKTNSPLANFFAPLQLKQLGQAAAYELLTRPLSVLGLTVQSSEAMARQVFYETGGHPALLQFIGHELVAESSRKGVLQIRRPQWQQVLQSEAVRAFCRHICLDHLGSAETAVLLATANADKWSGSELASRFAQAADLVAIIDHLVLQNLWTVADSGWQLAVPMLKHAMRENWPRLRLKAALWEGYDA